MVENKSFWEKCWSKENIDALLPYLEKYNNSKSDEIDFFQKEDIKSVCDAACGFGAYTLALASNGFTVKAFDISEGEVETKIKTSEVSYDGHIGYVDVSGIISLTTIESDLSLLYEDLLIAFYKSRGGQMGISRDFLNYINKDIKESQYTRFIEI